ncbi:uncharacterized protein LOC144711111 [Wolffia australiana]
MEGLVSRPIGVGKEMGSKGAILVPALAALASGWALRALLLPPPARPCGSPGGPPVTSPRVKLSDGRHLAYRERGVPRDVARHKIIFVHPFAGSKDFPFNVSQELLQELGVCIVSYDRAGYGESDPNPRRNTKSDAEDIRQLADHLDLGDRFFLIGISMGGYATWSCIKHIPHRLAGVALVFPILNYWWPSLPREIRDAAFREMDPADRRMFKIARRAPWLLHAYVNQKLVTPSKIISMHPDVLCPQDQEILQSLPAEEEPAKPMQQGEHESLHRDLICLVGDWGFEPEGLPDPFAGGQGTVHIWQGSDDKMVQPVVQRYVAGKIPWVRYHELPSAGHLFFFVRHRCEAILKELIQPSPLSPPVD